MFYAGGPEVDRPHWPGGWLHGPQALTDQPLPHRPGRGGALIHPGPELSEKAALHSPPCLGWQRDWRGTAQPPTCLTYFSAL